MTWIVRWAAVKRPFRQNAASFGSIRRELAVHHKYSQYLVRTRNISQILTVFIRYCQYIWNTDNIYCKLAEYTVFCHSKAWNSNITGLPLGKDVGWRFDSFSGYICFQNTVRNLRSSKIYRSPCPICSVPKEPMPLRRKLKTNLFSLRTPTSNE